MPTANDSELDISIVDNATLRVTAPDGSSTGVNSPTGLPAVKGSADAAYFAIDNAVSTDQESLQPTSTTYSVQYHAPTQGASYTITATGLHAGSYFVNVRYVGATGTVNNVASTEGVAATRSV